MTEGAALPSWSLQQLTSELERLQLHGHGGAFFPTATKLHAVAAQKGRPVIVVNGTEGEPLSTKDRFLLWTRVHQVLDGAEMTARAIGADRVVIAVDERRVKVLAGLSDAITAHQRIHRSTRYEVTGVPPGYITGQETALLQALRGRPAKPTTTPPYPFEKGLGDRPTLVSNTETFAQIGLIARGDYRARRLVTVSGAVNRRAVVQVSPATTVADALTAAGGISEGLQAVLLGGYGGTWARTPDAFLLAMCEPELRQRGLTLGAGILFGLGQSACAVAEVARVTRWMAGQSAGQCGACLYGLDAIASELEELTRTGTGPRGVTNLTRWAAMVRRRGACAHPDGVARFVASALDVFAEEFADHARHGGCDRCDAPGRLPTPPGGGFGFGPASQYGAGLLSGGVAA